jgi:hypothetical protein
MIIHPLHTWGIFQILDRLAFGVIKGVKQALPKKDDLAPAADHARRVFMAYERATVSASIRGAQV